MSERSDSAHDEPFTDSKRRFRNDNEKRRRDAFNRVIAELADMVGGGDRIKEKSKVLNATINFLRINSGSAPTAKGGAAESRVGAERGASLLVAPDEHARLLLDSLGAGVLVLNGAADVLFASASLQSILDADVADGCCFADLLSPASANELRRSLAAQLFKAASVALQPAEAQYASSEFETLALVSKASPSRRFRLVGRSQRIAVAPSFGGVDEPTEALCFVAVVAPSELTASLAVHGAVGLDFVATFSTEWRFIDLDKRAYPIIGYEPFEVLGASGYDFYHPDDLEQIALEHGELQRRGECLSRPYRFLTKAGQWLWLQSRSFVTYEQASSAAECVVVSSHVISAPASGRPVSPPPQSSTATRNAHSGSPARTKPPDSLPPGVEIEHSAIGAAPADAYSALLNSLNPLYRQTIEQLHQTAVHLRQQVFQQEEQLRQMIARRPP